MALQMGKLICQLRKARGMTQKELGEGLLSESELSRVENGTKKPDILILNALMYRLGATLEYFEIVVSGKEYERLRKRKGKEDCLPFCATVIAEGELLKDIRETRGWSQEQMSDGVCARETLSKMENGRSPNRMLWRKLLEKVGESQERYFGYVETVNYNIYVMVAEYQRLVVSNPMKAMELLEHIRNGLDRTNSINRQFLESSEAILKLLLGQLELGTELAAMERCLRYTMPEYDGGIYRIPHCQEVVILKEIIRCQILLGRIEQARYLEQMLIKKIGKKIKFS